MDVFKGITYKICACASQCYKNCIILSVNYWFNLILLILFYTIFPLKLRHRIGTILYTESCYDMMEGMEHCTVAFTKTRQFSVRFPFRDVNYLIFLFWQTMRELICHNKEGNGTPFPSSITPLLCYFCHPCYMEEDGRKNQ